MSSVPLTADTSTPIETVSIESPRYERLWIVSLIATLVFFALFPAQTPFINDEPLLIGTAIGLNSQGKLAEHGLTGTKGRRYGPLPLWVYQAILVVTHNPVAIMTTRIVLVSGGLLIAGAWLAHELKLWRWGLLAIALSPYTWFYTRMLWDNGFNIPLSMLALAAYASFLRRPRAWALMLAIASAGLMLLVHLMSAAVLGGLLLHLLITRRRELSKWTVAVFVAINCVLICGWVYWGHLFKEDPTFVVPNTSPNGWWFALLGPRIASGAWLDYLFPQAWLSANAAWYVAFSLFRVVSLLAFPLAWIGMGLGVLTILRPRHDDEQPSPRDALAGACATIVLAQIFLNGLSHTYGHPHYYTGTWSIFGVLMWITLTAVSRRRWGRAIGWIQVLSVAALSALLLARVIHTSGTRDMHFGATLANQRQIVRELVRYADDSTLQWPAEVFLISHSINCLQTLEPPKPPPGAPQKQLWIVYATDDPNDGRIKLTDQPPPP